MRNEIIDLVNKEFKTNKKNFFFNSRFRLFSFGQYKKNF